MQRRERESRKCYEEPDLFLSYAFVCCGHVTCLTTRRYSTGRFSHAIGHIIGHIFSLTHTYNTFQVMMPNQLC